MLSTKEVMENIVRALDSKKAKNITVLQTGNITVLADYFVICTAGSTSQIKSLSDEAGRKLTELDEAPRRVEGYRDGGWVLMDFGCVIVHIFLEEARSFYDLERLWSDAPEVDIAYLTTPNE
ncbi:MAG: ribosome silencing factor [Clostridiales bacterium]|nr:ribosome silencing factor [Clostridiales bacterium]